MSGKERRQFTRLPFDGVVSLSHNNRIYQGTLIDISLSGALVQINDNNSLLKETGLKSTQGRVVNKPKVKFNFSLNNNAIKIFFKGNISHIKNCDFGIECEEIDMNSAKHLKRLIELNLGESLLLARELSALILPK